MYNLLDTLSDPVPGWVMLRDQMDIIPAKGLLGAHKDVGNILVLAQQRDVEENLERLAVGGQHNKLRLPAVQSLRRLVSTLKTHLMHVDVWSRLPCKNEPSPLSQKISIFRV